MILFHKNVRFDEFWVFRKICLIGQGCVSSKLNVGIESETIFFALRKIAKLKNFLFFNWLWDPEYHATNTHLRSYQSGKNNQENQIITNFFLLFWKQNQFQFLTIYKKNHQWKELISKSWVFKIRIFSIFFLIKASCQSSAQLVGQLIRDGHGNRPIPVISQPGSHLFPLAMLDLVIWARELEDFLAMVAIIIRTKAVDNVFARGSHHHVTINFICYWHISH